VIARLGCMLAGHDWTRWRRARLLLAVEFRVCGICGKREFR
jgi:hypothetical protein